MNFKHFVRKHSFILLIIALLLSSCGRSNPKQDEKSTRPTGLTTDENQSYESVGPLENFDELCNQIFRENVSSNRITMHFTVAYPENYGINDYEITMGDYSDPSNYKAKIDHYLKEIKDFTYEELSHAQQITYDILLDYLETELDGCDYMYYEGPINSSNGDQIILPVLLSEYSFYRKNDIPEYLQLIDTFDTYFEGLVAYEKQRAERGFFMTDETIDKVLSQCRDFIKSPDENPLICVFDEKIDAFEGLEKAEREEYKTRNKDIVMQKALPAYNYLIDELSKLKGSNQFPGGASNLPDGKKYYEYLVKSYTGSNKSVEELKSIIETKTSEYTALITALCLKDLEAVMDSENYSFHIEDPYELTEHFREAAKADFPEIPKVEYEIKPVHKSMEEYMNPALYIRSPFDLPSKNTIYINKNDKYKQQNSYSTVAHEGYPGHLYQHQYLNTTDLCDLRKIMNFRGYTEGWATYIETVSYSYCDADPTTQSALAINGPYSLSLYSYLDIAINYDGWSYEQVHEYLASKGITDGEIAKTIYDTLIEDPAVYLQYFIGYLELKELLDKATEQLGDKFVLKEFHKFMLDFGPAQFFIIDKYMNKWIEEQMSADSAHLFFYPLSFNI